MQNVRVWSWGGGSAESLTDFPYVDQLYLVLNINYDSFV